MESTVYEYIIKEEARFKVDRVPVAEGWDWNFAEHIKRCILMKNSRFEKAKLGDKPFRNIIRPILNVAYRSEGFEAKDIEPYVNSSEHHWKSFLTRKYNVPFCRKHDIDTLIDDVVESYVDFGISIDKDIPNSAAPEHVPVQQIAFCDQTNFKGGPVCLKHSMTVDQMLDMNGIWDDGKIDLAITMAQSEKTNAQASDQKQKTPGKYIEVYELHGMLPKKWLASEDADGGDTKRKYERQMHIVCYYKDESGDKKGITLFSGPMKDDPFKVLVRGKIYNRCAGFSAIEELFEPQVWTNYDAIQMKEMLDVATMIVLQTADEAFKNRNPKITDMEKGQIVYTEEGKPVTQVGITVPNIQLFEQNAQQWQNAARTTGSANDGLLGERPSPGTPFALEQEVNMQGMGIHDWHQGKVSTYFSEMYRDWILEDLVKEMNDGKDFSETLTLDELNEIADAISINASNQIIEDMILSNRRITPAEQALIIEEEKQKFMRGGSRRFISVLKDELKGLPSDVYVNIKGKQKDMRRISQVLTNIFRQVIANPEVLKNPAIAKIFNDLLESSGMSALDFASLTRGVPAQAQAPTGEAPVADPAAATAEPVTA